MYNPALNAYVSKEWRHGKYLAGLRSFAWWEEGQELVFAVPAGAKPGEEHEFSYTPDLSEKSTDDGGKRYVTVKIPEYPTIEKSVDGVKRTVTCPVGAMPGEEHEFSYVGADGTPRFFKAKIPADDVLSPHQMDNELDNPPGCLLL